MWNDKYRRKHRYVATHERDIWNPPEWALSPAVSVRVGEAATLLGVSRDTLNRKTDLWGLTVLRGPGKARFFLKSEIELLTNGHTLDADSIRGAMRGRHNGTETTLEAITRRQKRRRGKGFKD